jgi:hypothetical protein
LINNYAPLDFIQDELDILNNYPVALHDQGLGEEIWSGQKSERDSENESDLEYNWTDKPGLFFRIFTVGGLYK